MTSRNRNWAVAVILFAKYLTLSPSHAYEIAFSSNTRKTLTDLKILSQIEAGMGGLALSSAFFDQSPLRSIPRFDLARSLNPRPAYQRFPLRPLFPSNPAAFGRGSMAFQTSANGEKVSNEPYKTQEGLGMVHLGYPRALQSTLSGNLYRFNGPAREMLLQATPNTRGFMWNNKREFVGGWKNTATGSWNSFMAVTGKDGKDHLYTFRDSKKAQLVYKDGKSFASLPLKHHGAKFSDVEIGLDENLYAVYGTGARDFIYRWDPAKKLQLAASMTVEKETRQRQAQQGKPQTYTVDHRLQNFEVTRDGRIYTQFRGVVYEELNTAGDRYLVSGGQPGHFTRTHKGYPTGNIYDLRIDSYGNLYTDTIDEGIYVNNRQSGVNMAIDMLKIDDQGYIYRVLPRGQGTDAKHIIKRDRVLQEPGKAEGLAAKSHRLPS